MKKIFSLLAIIFISYPAFTQRLLYSHIPYPILLHQTDSTAANIVQPKEEVKDTVATTHSVAPSDSVRIDSLTHTTKENGISATLSPDSIASDTLQAKPKMAVVLPIDPLDSLIVVYRKKMGNIYLLRDSLQQANTSAELDPYSCLLVLPPTFYRDAIHRVMTTRDTVPTDAKIIRLDAIYRMYTGMYLTTPWHIVHTDEEVSNSGTLRNDITEQSIQNHGQLAEKVAEANLPNNLSDVEVVTRRPQFWKCSGNTSFKFTQNHFSDNWFQGGDDSYSGMSTLNLYANFNNQRKFIWENSLSAQLGFQTSKNDTERAFRPTSNNVRLNTKLGLQAWKNLYYTTNVNMSTQIVPNYDQGTHNCNTDFMSPFDMTVSVGLNYNFNIKNKVTGSIVMAPVAYTLRYVERDRLVTRYGIRPNHNSFHRWGPNVNVNAKWPITKNINWNTRIYWFSNLDYTTIEWENTINFTISRFVNASFFIYPKFDDSAERYKNKDGKYIMLKQWFSMGLNYNF